MTLGQQSSFTDALRRRQCVQCGRPLEGHATIHIAKKAGKVQVLMDLIA